MRVRGSGSTGSTGAPKSTRRGAAGFALGNTGSASGPTAAPAAAAAAAERTGAVAATFLDAAEALRGLERRRQAVETGRRSLDRLRELQAAILAGRIDPALAGRLAALAREPRVAVDDPDLQGILDEIALRIDLEMKRIAREPVRAKRRSRA